MIMNDQAWVSVTSKYKDKTERITEKFTNSFSSQLKETLTCVSKTDQKDEIIRNQNF